MPLDHDEAVEKPAAPKALVRIIDRDHEKQSGTALLRQLYNFTSAEFEIAVRLARGENLKRISDKTDTHRRAELVPHVLAEIP